MFTATKAEAMYEELRSRILDGSLAPGATLDQKALADEYQISTTPIREALRRLESEHLVIVKAHHGPRVSQLSAQELHYLFAIRLELDPLAARLAVNAPAEQRALIAKSAEHRMGESTTQWVASNRHFHRAVYEACGNPVLVQILDSLWNRCDRYRFLLAASEDAGQVEREQHEHVAMAAALERGDGGELGLLVREHIQHSYERLARLAGEFTGIPTSAVSD